jgi:iron complex outermembrane recepter protein
MKTLRMTARLSLMAGAALGAMTSAAWAQTAASPAAEAAPDTIVVTGSRIARPNLEGTSPVQVVNAEEFRTTGTVNVEQLLNTLPQIVPGVTAFTNNGGGGVATVNLRNLGSARTLVLVDGRRYIPFGTGGQVDLNTIPQAMIERVDVVTGGGSAVYGSDAIAGTVNFIMKRNFEGLSAASQYRVTGKGDGDQWTADVAVGMNSADGKGNVAFYGGYSKRGTVLQGDRPDSVAQIADVVGTPPGTTFGGSPTGPVAVIDPSAAFAPFGASTFAIFDGQGNLRPYVNPTRTEFNDAFNFAPFQYLQLPQERWLFGGSARYEITDWAEFYTGGTFVKNKVVAQLAASPANLVPGTGPVTIQVNSPFFSAATQTLFRTLDTTQATLVGGIQNVVNDGYVTLPNTFRRRTMEAGARDTITDRQAFNAFLGFRGDISDNWKYDTYYTYMETKLASRQTDTVRSRLRAGIETAFRNPTTGAISATPIAGLTGGGELVCRDAAARTAGCVPLNVFAANGVSTAGADYLRIILQDQLEAARQVASGYISGTVPQFDLGAGALGLVIGAEWRSESARFTPDAAKNSGDILGFNATRGTQGRYSVKELFGEINMPLLADLPFAEKLEVSARGRYSDYTLSAIGGVSTYSGSLLYKPISDLTFRAEYQRAVRAPSVGELFGGQGQSFPSANDPCSDRIPSGQTAAVRALCVATGVPAAAVFTRAVQPTNQVETLTGGNPLLKQEVGKTLTLGAVFTPEYVPGLSLTVDFYRIKLEGAISVLGGSAANVLNLCYNVVQNATSSFCGAIARQPSGNIQQVRVLNANIGEQIRRGIDFQADYALPLGFGPFEDSSTLRFQLTGSWLDRYDITPVAEIPTDKLLCMGTFGSNCGEPDPEWKFTLRTSYSSGPMALNLRWRWLDGTVDDRTVFRQVDAATLPFPKIKAYSYFDLSGSFSAGEHVTLTAGVDNLLNKGAPLLGSAASLNANTYPDTYDVLGRKFFFGANIKF